MKISGWHGYRGRRLTWRVVSNVTLDVRAPVVMIWWIQQLPSYLGNVWTEVSTSRLVQAAPALASNVWGITWCHRSLTLEFQRYSGHGGMLWHVHACVQGLGPLERPAGCISKGPRFFPSRVDMFCHLIVGATLPRLSIGLPCQYNWNLQNYKLRDLLGRFEQRDVLWLGWILNREMQARQIKGTGRVIPWSTCAQASMVVSNLFFRHRGMCQLQRWPLPLLVRHQRGIQGLENSRFFIAVAARPGATSASQCEACGKGHLMNWGDGD